MINKIKLIEIELHSYCNRKCFFCPNNFIDRTVKNTLDRDIFKKLIDDLSDVNYSNYISFSRYNEPLSDVDMLVESMSYIHSKLPQVKMVTNTNGDFLSYDILKRISTYLSELTIMNYDNKRTEQMINILEYLQVEVLKISNGEVHGIFNGMKILYKTFNPSTSAGNRGGSLDIKKEKRNKPCFEPQLFIGIDYNGNVMPCCNLRSDYHTGFELGNLNDDNIINIIKNEKSKRFRLSCLKSNMPTPCEFCDKEPGRYTRENPGIEYRGD